MCVRPHSVPKEMLINETMKGETEMKGEAEVKRGTEIKGETEMKDEVASHSSTVSVLEKF